jgi:hypothetical protein
MSHCLTLDGSIAGIENPTWIKRENDSVKKRNNMPGNVILTLKYRIFVYML